jgi:short-subunit dehydrogenase
MTFAEHYGPWALIAGASEGTGSAFARQVAAEGINCFLVARRTGPLEELAGELQSRHGIECRTASIDLSADDASSRLSRLTSNSEIGLFINNAGSDTNGSLFLDTALKDCDALVARNVTNTMRNCHHFAGLMRTRRRGGIILVGSGACYGGIPGIAVYCASKAFDLCFGEGLWVELKPYGVDVLNLILGQTDTPAYREFLRQKGQPVPANLASPAEVARVGLARLPHGPVHNWALADDETGYAVSSAAARRQRVLAIAQMSAVAAKPAGE